MIQPPVVPDLIPGRAGQRTRSVKPVIITLHIQEGTNSLPEYFRHVAADSTLWCDRDGTMYRMLLDSDTPWSNGDALGVLLHSPYLDKVLWLKDVTNTNEYALTIETAGYQTVQDAIDKGGLSPAQAQIYGHITPAQYNALVAQCAAWCDEYGIPVDGITRHSDVGEHKFCPGPAVDVEKIRVDVAKILSQKVQSVYDPNPKKLSIGPGILAEMVKRQDVAVTNEQYYDPSPNQSGLLKRSMAWGRNFFYVAFLDAHGTWTVQVFKSV